MGSLAINVPISALETLMPLHLRIDIAGNIAGFGPLFPKLRTEKALWGRPFFEVFDVLRPHGVDTVDKLFAGTDGDLRLRFRSSPQTPFKGSAVAMPQGGALVNLSFGISVVDAVSQYKLTLADFAPTDLAVEMLYLVEAKSTAMAASQDLNKRLRLAKMAAEERAFTDTLTGLRNRRALDAALDRLVGSGESFGVINLDLDYFKEVNDTFGHAAGDCVLRKVSREMLYLIRAHDTAARVGGDEFVIIVRNVDDPSVVTAISRRLIDRLLLPIQFEGHELKISVSIGITLAAADDPRTAEDLLKCADAALYDSKRNGRGRLSVYSADPDRSVAQSECKAVNE